MKIEEMKQTSFSKANIFNITLDFSVLIIVIYIARFLLRVFDLAVFSTTFNARHNRVSARKCSSATKHGVCFWVEPYWLKLDAQVRR